MLVSTPEVTALDLVRYSFELSGLSAVAVAIRYFLSDVLLLIRVGLDYSPSKAFELVFEKLVALVPN